MAKAAPAPEVTTTGYALRGVNWLLVFAPNGPVFDVDLRRMPGQLQIEWLDTATGMISTDVTFEGGRRTQLFSPPTTRGTLLYLRPARSSLPSLATIEGQLQAIRSASRKYSPVSARLRSMLASALDEANRSHRRQLALFLGFALFGFAAGFGVAYFLGRARS